MDSNVTLPLNLDASFRISALNKRSALFLETSHSFCKSENRLILENSLKKAEFARKFGLGERQAHNYMRRFKGMEYLSDYYDVLHTQSFDDAIESMAIICQRNGGQLSPSAL